jgi:hypothetical protein
MIGSLVKAEVGGRRSGVGRPTSEAASQPLAGSLVFDPEAQTEGRTGVHRGRYLNVRCRRKRSRTLKYRSIGDR